MNKEKVNCFGFLTLIVALSGAAFYGVFSSYMISYAKTASIISMVIGFVISLIISKILITFFKQKENLSFVNKIKYIYGKFSIVINILLIICSLFMYILFTYRLTSFLSSQYLIEMSQIFLLIMILFITYYIASKGLETTTRVSTISFFLGTFIYIFDATSLMKQIDFDNYLPLITVDTNNILLTSIMFALYFSVPIFYLNIASFNQITNKEKFNKIFYIILIISFMMPLISLITTIGVSGINVISLFDYPLYTILKKINLFTFLDSIENVSIMLWILYIINASSAILLFIYNSVKETFNIKKKNSNIIFVIILLISFLIPKIFLINNTFMETFKYIYIPIIIASIILLINIISLIIIKKKS